MVHVPARFSAMDISEFTGSRRLAAAPRPPDLVRLGLVSGAVLMTGLAFGALIYLMEPDSPKMDSAETVTSRLPRPRPHEPFTTGSIKPARPVAFDLESALAAEPDDSVRPRASDDLRSRAVLTASASAECDEVASSEVLDIRSNPEAPDVVWVQCRNGKRFYLDRDRLEGEILPPQPVAADSAMLSDMEAVRACEDNVRLGLPVPDSLVRRSWSTGVARAPGDDPVVSFELDALNGLGFPLAMQVKCIFDDGRLARLHVDPR